MKKKTILKFQSVTCKLLSAIFLSVCIVFSICVYYSFAEVPCKINYQGRLIKDNVPVDGTNTMVFSIYDSAVGGTLRWTSGDVDITVYNGLFRYVLDLLTIDWTAGETLYLEVKVGPDILTPREAIYAYPYAINSHLLEGATKEYFLNISGDTQTKDGGLNIIGNVGIGTTSPIGPLEVKADNQGSLVLRLSNKTNGGSIDFWSYGIQSVGENLYLRGGSGKGLSLGVDGIDNKLYINTSGNVGIGTTSPGEKLTVAGTIESTTGGVKFPDGTLQTTAPRAPTIEVINGSQNVQYTRNHSGYVKIQFNHVCRSDAGNLTIKFKVDGIVQKQFTVNTNYITIPSPTFVYYGQKSGNFTFKLEVSQSGGAYSAIYTQFIVTEY